MSTNVPVLTPLMAVCKPGSYMVFKCRMEGGSAQKDVERAALESAGIERGEVKVIPLEPNAHSASDHLIVVTERYRY